MQASSQDVPFIVGMTTKCRRSGQPYRTPACGDGDWVFPRALLREEESNQVVVIGSPMTFKDRGIHTLKGIEGEWQLYSVITQ